MLVQAEYIFILHTNCRPDLKPCNQDIKMSSVSESNLGVEGEAEFVHKYGHLEDFKNYLT